LILVTYVVNIVPDLCAKWKRTLEKEFKRIHAKYCVRLSKKVKGNKLKVVFFNFPNDDLFWFFTGINFRE